MVLCFFFFNDTATTEIYTLSLHDALPICGQCRPGGRRRSPPDRLRMSAYCPGTPPPSAVSPSPSMSPELMRPRSEEHTSELQSRQYLVCRLLLEKKKT